MKIVCQLPDRKHYKSITPTEQWYRWEDRGNPKVRLMCKSIDPWQYEEVAVMFLLAMSKSDKSEYPAALHLKIYPNPEKEIRKGKIVREYFKAAYPHSQADGLLFFAAFPANTNSLIPHWLGYSFLAEPESIAEAIDRYIRESTDKDEAIKRIQRLLKFDKI